MSSFDLLAEAQNDGFRVARKSTSMGGQYNGACILPTCQGIGEDRLRIQPNKGEFGRFVCSICGQSGSGVDWLMLVRGMSKNEALQYVGWKPQDGSTPKFTIPKSALTQYSTHEAPPKRWQEAAKAFVQYCEDALWGEAGKEALEYLHGRGLKDQTIKIVRLGYNPKQLRQSADKWGLQRHNSLWKGIVIPWFIDRELWRITVRDETVPKGESGRYKQVKGGSNGLYLGDFLIYENRPVILVEGEFDALSILQECGKHVIVCATGTTQGSHTTRWISELARKDIVLVAFDAERDKGDKSAQWWEDRLENYKRLRPHWGDANQMLQDGVDLWNDWIFPRLVGLRNHAAIPVATTPEVPATLPLVTASVAGSSEYQASTKPVPTTLKCLSIQQPWSWLIVNGHKDIENRDWSTGYRGLVLIHAGGKVDGDWFIDGQLDDHPMRDLAPLDMPSGQSLYPRGAIVGIATLVDVVESSQSLWFVGKYGFVFVDPKPFKNPIPYKGQLGLFDVPREVVEVELTQHTEPAQLPEHEEYIDPLNFCSVCGGITDEIIEDDAGQLVAYCSDHLPTKKDKPMTRDEIEKLYRDALPGWSVEVMTVEEWETHKDAMARSDRAHMVKSIQRAPMQQWLVDYWIEHGELPDYWTILEQKLARKGYDKDFKETEQALLNRVETPRVYPCPVPRYELQEDDHGVVHLVTVGYWEASA